MYNPNGDKEFSRLRTAFWPIYSHELKFFVSMGMIIFCAVFNYTIMRNTKDALINTALSSGPEVLCFIKSWCVMPSAILFVLVYSKLSNVFSREKLYYILIMFFLGMWALFAFYLYPNQSWLHPSIENINELQLSYPRLQWLFPVYGIWTYTLFYVVTELWGSIVVSVLFWQFANEVVSTIQAKRFYPFFMVFSNLSMFFSGIILEYITTVSIQGEGYEDIWGITLNQITWVVISVGVSSLFIYYWLNNRLLNNGIIIDNGRIKTTIKKPILNLQDSIKCIFTSPYLGYVAILVIAYGSSMNLIEIIWKKQIAIQFPNPNDYNSFMGRFSQFMGILAILVVFFTKNIIWKRGWFMGAISTPLILGFTSILFFLLLYSKEYLAVYGPIFGINLAMLVIWAGATQNALSKGAKYSLFDPTNQMAYMPLDEDLKIKGKAAVDVFAARLGKASGGYIQQILLIITAGNIITITPYISIFIILVITFWIFSVTQLNKKYQALINKTEAIPDGKKLSMPQMPPVELKTGGLMERGS